MPAMYVVACVSSHGNRIANTAIIAPIFGMIANVCSCICVTAWKIETSKPTTIPQIRMGAARRVAIRMASIIMATTRASVINTNLVV